MKSQGFNNLPRSREDARRLGLRHFFTGRPCKYGHIAPRYVSTTQCVICQLEYTRKNSGHQARPSKSAYLTRARTTIEAWGGVLLSSEYVSAKTKLEVYCPRGHEFLITPDDLKRGKRCPKCNRENQSKRLAAKFRSVQDFVTLPDNIMSEEWLDRELANAQPGHLVGGARHEFHFQSDRSSRPQCG
jgi:hypothetical protein